MGTSSSKFESSGTLKGAFAPPLPNVVPPAKLDPQVKKYALTVPSDKGPGDKMIVNIRGYELSVTIPDRISSTNGETRRIRSGDKFTITWGDRERVIASTLPSLPGSTIVEAKPIIFANTSHAFFNWHMNDQFEQSKMSKKVASLMQEAQTMLLQKAVEVGCNAVLSINCNVSTDSSGNSGNSKIVIVTMIGTPCVIVPLSEMPAVTASDMQPVVHATAMIIEPENIIG